MKKVLAFILTMVIGTTMMSQKVEAREEAETIRVSTISEAIKLIKQEEYVVVFVIKADDGHDCEYVFFPTYQTYGCLKSVIFGAL